MLYEEPFIFNWLFVTSSCLFRLFRITCYVSLDLPFHLQIICPSLFSGHFVSCYIFYEKMPLPLLWFFYKISNYFAYTIKTRNSSYSFLKVLTLFPNTLIFWNQFNYEKAETSMRSKNALVKLLFFPNLICL